MLPRLTANEPTHGVQAPERSRTPLVTLQHRMNLQYANRILLLLGAMFCAAAVYRFIDNQDFLQRAVRVEGTVVELNRKIGRRARFPVVQYTDHLGREHKLYSRSGSYPPSHFLGEKVTVLLDPGDPKYPLSARIESFFHLWGVSVILTFVGVMMIGLSLLVNYALNRGGTLYFTAEKKGGE